MKKALAFLLAFMMLLSLAACGSNEATGTTPEATAGETKPVDKQAIYENFFTEENFKTIGESVKFEDAYLNVAIEQDQDENVMVELRIEENYLRIYQLKDGKQYVNIKVGEEDGWGEYKGENATETTGMDLSAANADLESILRVEYVETKDGVDIVKVYQENPDYNADIKITEYRLAFQYEDQDCEMVATVETDSEGGEGASYDTDAVVEGFDVTNYTIDYENKVMINIWDESEEIPFEIVFQEEITADPEIGLEVYIDEATQQVTSMQQCYGDGVVTVEFYNVESCLDGVEIPEDIEELSDEELGLAILGLLFSAVDFDMEA